MPIPPIPSASGAPRDDDPSPAADDEAQEPRPTRPPAQGQFDGLRSASRRGSSEAPADAEIIESQPRQNTGGPSPRTTLVSRSIDAMHDSFALESVLAQIARAPAGEKPALLIATAKRLATLLNEPNSWTDSEKIYAFVLLVSGATDALNSSDQPDFERYAEVTETFAELVPHLPVNEEVRNRRFYFAGLMVDPPVPAQHLEARTNALFRAAKNMPQPIRHNLFMDHAAKMQEIKQGERAPILNAMTSNLDLLLHFDELGTFLLGIAEFGQAESESLGRSVLERVIDRFGPYLDACKAGLSDMENETKNFHLLLDKLEPNNQGETHAPALAGLAAICDKLPFYAQGPAFDKILDYATRSAEPGAVLKSLIDALPTIHTADYEERYQRLRTAIDACGKPQSDELFAQLSGENRAT